MLCNLEEIILGLSEQKLVEYGWGKKVANEVSVNKFFYISNGINVKGYLSLPKNVSEKLPVIIWNRGGNEKAGMLDDFLAFGILGEIASWGYIVFASQYRDKDEFGGQDVNDILYLLDESMKFEFSDEHRIGMEGWSRGGMMTYITLTKTGHIKTAIVTAGLSDLFRNEESNKKLGDVYRNHFGTENSVEFKKRKMERSAVYWADKILNRTSILFIHGTADKKISVEDSREMYEKLTGINTDTNYELILIDGGDHYLKNYKKEIALIRKNWFDSNLKFIR